MKGEVVEHKTNVKSVTYLGRTEGIDNQLVRDPCWSNIDISMNIT